MSNSETEYNPTQKVLAELIAQVLWDEIPSQLNEMHVQDMAAVIDNCDDTRTTDLLLLLAADVQDEVFSYLRPEKQFAVLDITSNSNSRRLIQNLSSDDLTRLLETVQSEQSEQLLNLLTPREVKAALKLLGYPE